MEVNSLCVDDLVKKLVRNHPDAFNVKNMYGRLPIEQAAFRSNEHTVKNLICHTNPILSYVPWEADQVMREHRDKSLGEYLLTPDYLKNLKLLTEKVKELSNDIETPQLRQTLIYLYQMRRVFERGIKPSYLMVALITLRAVMHCKCYRQAVNFFEPMRHQILVQKNKGEKYYGSVIDPIVHQKFVYSLAVACCNVNEFELARQCLIQLEVDDLDLWILDTDYEHMSKFLCRGAHKLMNVETETSTSEERPKMSVEEIDSYMSLFGSK